MPYKSEKQRRYMHAKHPDIAKRWDKETGGAVKPAAKKAVKGAIAKNLSKKGASGATAAKKVARKAYKKK